MAGRGQGERKVHVCLAKHGDDFRNGPRTEMGLLWCRHCGYRVDQHEKIRMNLRVVPRGDGSPKEGA